MRARAIVGATRDGRYRLRIGGHERDLLRGLCGELRELLRRDDDAVSRLYPAAYRDDDEAAAEFARLVRPDQRKARLEALDLVAGTLEEELLDQKQAEALCGALNDLRLVLGERLGVTEDVYEDGIDPRDPLAPQLALYGWLTWLQSALVEALASRL